ncbi:MAG: LuxR C-terminal-related transcriptional regulator [Pelovirga sp.]
MADDKRTIDVLVAVDCERLSERICQVLEEEGCYRTESIQQQGGITAPDILFFDQPDDLAELLPRYAKARSILIDARLTPQELAHVWTDHRVRGVMAPDVNPQSFHRAIRTVKDGDLWINSRCMKALLLGGEKIAIMRAISALSEKDKNISLLISRGVKIRDIGAALTMSENTVKAHLGRIYRGLKVMNRAGLARFVKTHRAFFPIEDPQPDPD